MLEERDLIAESQREIIDEFSTNFRVVCGEVLSSASFARLADGTIVWNTGLPDGKLPEEYFPLPESFSSTIIIDWKNKQLANKTD